MIVALWDRDDALNSAAQSALDSALNRGSLVVPAPMFAELMAFPGRSEALLDGFFADTDVAVDWEIGEQVWRAAGRALQSYAGRRRKHSGPGPRRILADFIIGACAVSKGLPLLTLDEGFYRAGYPEVKLLRV